MGYAERVRNKLRKKPRVMDRSWGIDRYPGSPTKGDLMVRAIFMWNKPGALALPKNMTGAIPHDLEVQVVETRREPGKNVVWVRIRARHRGNDGKVLRFVGWIPRKFLKELGAQDFGEKDIK